MDYMDFLIEGRVPSKLYHASPTQGLKFLDPTKTVSTHLKNNKPYVYGTDEKDYAAGFCFEWSNNEGFRFGSEDYGEPWELKVPRRYQHRLKGKCSMYTMSGAGFRKVYGMDTPEFYKAEKVKLIKEVKYKTALECLNVNKVILTFI